MADRKISDLTALTAPASGDYLPIVDISEASAANKNKRITIEELLRGAPDGTAAAPAFAFESDGGNGIYLAGTDTVGLATNGVARVTVSTTAVSSTLAVDHPLGAVGTPSITFTGDLNTGLWSPTADTIAASTGGSERARIDSSGRLLVGTSTSQGVAGGFTCPLQVASNNNENSGLSIFRYVNNTFGVPLALAKSRSSTLGSHTILQSGDTIADITWSGSDGNAFIRSAAIAAQIDGTPGANDMPGRLVFSTTADGASSSTERVGISANGLSTFGSQAASGAALTVTAPAKIYSGTGTYTDTATAASGTVTHGTVAAFDNPAIAATNATVTYTNASTVYIDGAPTNGTNVTITNPYALYVNAGTSFFGGNVNLSSGNEYRINNIKVVGARITGWAAATGTATRTTFATSTVTTEQLAERVKALVDDLISHGLIGT